jgi:hypothetical protein
LSLQRRSECSTRLWPPTCHIPSRRHRSRSIGEATQPQGATEEDERADALNAPQSDLIVQLIILRNRFDI